MSSSQQDSEDLDSLAEAYVERLRRGETPDLEAYARDHPHLAERIRSLFPLLSVMEGVSVDPASTPGGVPAPKAPAAPERIGDYRILATLGQGGMGRVYRARLWDDEESDAAAVAIKVIHPHLVADAGCLARFLREAEAGRRIRHANVVHTLDAGVLESGGVEVPYLVLEHVEGQTLRALLDEVGRVPERLARLVGRKVADALVAIHAEGIIHRDIKPANVLITADETVKVMDLGVALLQDEAFRLSGTGEFVGSLLYAAPEQLDGRTPDARADLYALGLTLYEIAAGRLPARRSSGVGTGELPHASPFFSAVVQTLLEQDPDARFASAAELREVLAAGERSSWWRRRDKGRAKPPTWLRTPRFETATELVGRREEMDDLTGAFDRAGAGDGQVVLIQGEAGVGKSRLVYEWLHTLQQAQSAVRAVVVKHAPGSDVAAVPPLAEAFVAAFGLQRLQKRIQEVLGAGSYLAQALARLVSGGGDTALPTGLAKESLGTAWLHLLRAIARDAPLVLVFEDLHFAGQEANALFQLIARGVRGDPLLLIGTTRPHPDADAEGLRDLTHVTPMALGGLDTSSCRTLLRATQRGGQPLPEEATLIRKSDGNPFFLLEMVRTLREGGLPEQEDGDPTTGIPSTVRSIIERRLSRLTERQRELLEAGACCGFEFDPTLVAEAAGLPLLDALKRFARLERTTGLLQTAGANYAFRHHLVHEVLYDDMHPSLRQAYHAAIGRVLLARQVSRPLSGSDAAALCRHLLAGGRAADASAYVAPALEFLTPRGHYALAIEIGESALASCPLLVGRDRALTLLQLNQAMQSLGRYDEAGVVLQEASDQADELEDAELASHARQHLAMLLERRADHEGALSLFRAATELAAASGDAGNEAQARAGLAAALMRQRKLTEASEEAEAGLELVQVAGDEVAELDVVHTLAQLHVRPPGDMERARELLQRASELAQRLGNRARQIGVISTLGHLAYRQSDFATAHEHLGRAIELARELGRNDDLPHLRINDASVLLYMGREEEAQEVSEQALADSIAIGHRTAGMRARARLCEVLRSRGHFGQALEEFRTVFAEANRVGDPAIEGSGARGLSRVLAALGQVEESEAVLADCVERESPSSEPVYAFTYRGFGKMQAGRPDEAIPYFEKACALAAKSGQRMSREPLALGRACARVGDVERARTALQQAAEIGRQGRMPDNETMAAVYLATLPGGDPLSARVLLERNERYMNRLSRMEAHFTLWEATGDSDNLRSARAHLEYVFEHAPPEYHDDMLRNDWLYRSVKEAWAEHGSAPTP